MNLDNALKIIKEFEGLRLTAYQDKGGKWTIGYGSTGPGIEAGVKWSLEQAEDRLLKDVQELYQRIFVGIAGAPALVRAPTTDNQKDALLSFAYNLGFHNLARSGLLRFLNLRDYEKASEQFLLWNHIGSYVDAGLTHRRQEEQKLFLSESA